MQVGEQDLAGLQPLPLDLLRLLDLHDQAGGGEHGARVGQDLGAGPLIGGVLVAGALAGPLFDRHLVAVGDIFPDRGGRQAHPVFIRLDFLGHADAHVELLTIRSSRRMPGPRS